MREVLTTIGELAGAALVALGAGMIATAAGVIVGGLLLIGVCWLASR